MPRIFISYRRADSQNITDHLHGRLAEVFGKQNVFQDVMNIDYGAQFRQVLEEQVNTCDVLLVIIGNLWVNIKEIDPSTKKPTDQLRLFNPNDFVRIEVETGLANKNTRVIPVLVNGADVPHKNELPPELAGLSDRNAIAIRNNPYLDDDISRLIRQLRQPVLPRWGILAAVFAIAAILFVVFASRQPAPLTPAEIANQRLTQTAAVQVAALNTQAAESAINSIMTEFVSQTSVANITETAYGTATAEAYTDTSTATSTPSSTPTEDFAATINAQATLNMQATLSVPTNTPEPTGTHTQVNIQDKEKKGIVAR